MICRILLSMTLTSCVCEMSDHHYKALYYQAEENGHITIEWQFASKVGITIPSLKIHCLQLPELKVFYHLDNSIEEAQHEHFAGRVQCDRDTLTIGRVRLQLSRVRSNDSGHYLCRMATEFGKKVKEFRLNITAATVKPKLVTAMPRPKPKPERRGRICLFTGLAVGTVVLAAFLILIIYSTANYIKEKLMCSVSEE